MAQNSTSASTTKYSIYSTGFVPPASQNATVKSSLNYCIKRTIPIPIGGVGINVAVNTEKQLYISRILPECPISDEVKERDIITHVNGEDTKGDPDLFCNMLMNTMGGTRSITILRNVNSTYLLKDMVAKSSNSDNSSLVEGTEAIAKDLKQVSGSGPASNEGDEKDEMLNLDTNYLLRLLQAERRKRKKLEKEFAKLSKKGMRKNGGI
jgi:hypothetical protein